MAKGKRKDYTDDFRASAVIMLEAQGYPHVKGALTAVAKHLKVPHQTLRRWFNKEQNPPPPHMVREKRGELVEQLPDLLQEFVAEMFIAKEEATLQQLAMAFGIVFDKLQMLQGGPTERVAHEHDLGPDERVRRLNALLDTARTRRDGQIVDSTGVDTIH